MAGVPDRGVLVRRRPPGRTGDADRRAGAGPGSLATGGHAAGGLSGRRGERLRRQRQPRHPPAHQTKSCETATSRTPA